MTTPCSRYVVSDAREVFDHANNGAAWADAILDASARAVSDLAADLVATLGVTHVSVGGSIGLAEGYLARAKAHHAKLPVLFRAEMTGATCGTIGPLLGALLFADKIR